MPSVGLFSGPTGGHLIPAYLVAQELREQGASPTLYTPQSEILDRLPDLHFPLVPVDVHPWSGQSMAGKLRSLFSVLHQFIRIRSAVGKHDKLISFGGYPAIPGLLSGWLYGSDVYFQEQNRVPGRTHRVFAGLQHHTFYGFPPVEGSDASGAVLTGNPVRPPSERDDDWFETDALLVVFGGSQGSREVSEHLQRSAETLLDSGWSIYYITGKFGRDLMDEPWAQSTTFRQVEYDPGLHEVLPNATCVWSRAGAGTLSELIAYGVPGLVFPFGHATDDHQLKNAQWVAEHGPVDLVTQDEEPAPSNLVDRTESLRTGDSSYDVPWDRQELPQVRIARSVLT